MADKNYDKMTGEELTRLLIQHNPFGGYSIGKKKGQLSREKAIDTLRRYERLG